MRKGEEKRKGGKEKLEGKGKGRKKRKKRDEFSSFPIVLSECVNFQCGDCVLHVDYFFQ